MRIRLLLLAGTVLPFALNHPAGAFDRASGKPLVLAQAETQACPEGQECPPVDAAACPEGQECPPAEEPPPPPPQQPPPAEEPPPPAAEEPPPEQPPAEQPPAEEPPPAEQPPAEQPPAEQPPAPEQPAAEQPPAEQAPAEQPPAEQPAPEQPAAEQPPPQEPAPAEQPAAEQQTAPEQPAPTEEPAAPEQPATEQQAAPPPEAAPAEQQAAPQPEPAPQESVVEQQLEAQGDQEEANRVRTLREQLLDQLQQAIAPPPQEEPQQQQQQSSGDRRDRDGRGDRVWGRDEDQGEVVERRGTNIIIDLGGGNIFVEQDVPDEGGRLLYGADDVEVQELPRGRTRTIVHRPNGVDIVTVRDRYGNIIKRSRFLPDGREIVLIDNRYPDDDEYRLPPPILYDVPPPRVRIPRERYIVDLGGASDDDIRYALQAPLVQAPPRPYTLDEVLRNEEVRAYSPRIDLDTITFEFGSATIGNDQMGALFELGQLMEQVIAESPDEVYLIEGHTDAVGSDYDNLILSDQRAEAVATALSQNFDIPPENLVTEGYGEQFLKVDTGGPERQNRRATVRRLTELLQAQGQ